MADPITEPIIFPTAESDPRGKRYSVEDRESAYLLWSTTAGRSLRKVSDQTGISLSTLGTWHQRETWTARYECDEHEKAQILRTGIIGRVAEEFEKNIAKLVKLRDFASSEKVQLDATIALLGLGGLHPATKAQADTATAKPVQRPQFDDVDPGTPLTPEAAYQRQLARRERWARQAS